MVVKGQHPCWGLGGCTRYHGPEPCEGPGGYIGSQGPTPLLGSRRLRWQSSASTPVQIQGAALAVKGQKPVEVQGDTLAARASSLVGVQKTKAPCGTVLNFDPVPCRTRHQSKPDISTVTKLKIVHFKFTLLTHAQYSHSTSLGGLIIQLIKKKSQGIQRCLPHQL